MSLNTVLIVEDEKPNADRLKRLLMELRPDVRVPAVLESVSATAEWLEANGSPDLILLDVRLADGLSFEIFSLTDVTAPVIFTTAYDEYAVKAFKYNSIDYLLKPVDKEELEEALGKFERLSAPTQLQKADIDQLILSLRPKEYRSRFLLPYKDGFKTILLADVAFIYSDLNITYAMIKDEGTVAVPVTLEKLEQQLDPKQFFRVNRKYIINIDAIVRVYNHFNGKLKLDVRQCKDDMVLVSREKAPAFKRWMDF